MAAAIKTKIRDLIFLQPQLASMIPSRAKMKVDRPAASTDQSKNENEEGTRAKYIFALSRFLSRNSRQSPMKKKIQRMPNVLKSWPKYLRITMPELSPCEKPPNWKRYQSREVR